MIQILLWLLFGAVIGWVASLIMKSRKSLLMTIVLGIVGSFVGGVVASFVMGNGLNLTADFSFSVVNVLISVAGACLLIFIARALKILK